LILALATINISKKILLTFIILTTITFTSIFVQRLHYSKQLMVFVEKLSPVAKGKSIGGITITMVPFPLVELVEANWKQKFHYLWMLPAFPEDLNKLNNDQRELVKLLVDDLIKSNPEIMLVNGSLNYKVIELFSFDQRFKSWWSKYRLIMESNPLPLLANGPIEVFTRIDVD
jgi:hypothetical protein